MRRRKQQLKQPLPDGGYSWMVEWIDNHSNARSLVPVFAETAEEPIELAKQEMAKSENIVGARDWKAY
jgi:hypothetical protein